MHSDRKYLATVLRAAGAAGAALILGGCMTQSQSAPALAGPSGFGQAITMAATPDVVPRDGSSQSTVRLNYRDGSTNAPLGQRRLVVATDFGTLSTSEVVTDANGNASLTFTAPSVNTPTSSAAVTALPVGDNVDNARAQLVRIGLLGPDVPVAAFTSAPTTPAVYDVVTFDASTSASKLGGAACAQNCSYSWNFGDGSSAEGQVVQHVFQTSGPQAVTLTVSSGVVSSSLTKHVIVAAPVAPTANFTNAPLTPAVGVVVTFTSTSTVGAGGTIVRHVWDFGGGGSPIDTGSTSVVTTAYSAPGVYNVTLTVTDNLGRQSTRSNQLTVIP
jgi:PKD repeat protein